MCHEALAPLEVKARLFNRRDLLSSTPTGSISAIIVATRSTRYVYVMSQSQGVPNTTIA